jgi:hypothetical protein
VETVGKRPQLEPFADDVRDAALVLEVQKHLEAVARDELIVETAGSPLLTVEVASAIVGHLRGDAVRDDTHIDGAAVACGEFGGVGPTKNRPFGRFGVLLDFVVCGAHPPPPPIAVRGCG